MDITEIREIWCLIIWFSKMLQKTAGLSIAFNPRVGGCHMKMLGRLQRNLNLTPKAIWAWFSVNMTTKRYHWKWLLFFRKCAWLVPLRETGITPTFSYWSLPPPGPLVVSTKCCHQFIISQTDIWDSQQSLVSYLECLKTATKLF